MTVQEEARNVMNGLLGLLHVPLESGTTVRFSGGEEQPIPTPLKATAALSGVLGAIGVSAVVFGLFGSWPFESDMVTLKNHERCA